MVRVSEPPPVRLSATTLSPPLTPLSTIRELIGRVLAPLWMKSSGWPDPAVNRPESTAAPMALLLVSEPVRIPPVVMVKGSVAEAKLIVAPALMIDSVSSVAPPAGSVRLAFTRASTPVGTAPVARVMRFGLSD